METRVGQHTPGPWRATALGQTIAIDCDPVLGADMLGIAHIGNGDPRIGIPSARDKANARLIASAPALLAALEDVSLAIDVELKNGAELVSWEHYRQIVDAAIAAAGEA